VPASQESPCHSRPFAEVSSSPLSSGPENRVKRKRIEKDSRTASEERRTVLDRSPTEGSERINTHPESFHIGSPPSTPAPSPSTDKSYFSRSKRKLGVRWR